MRGLKLVFKSVQTPNSDAGATVGITSDSVFSLV